MKARFFAALLGAMALCVSSASLAQNQGGNQGGNSQGFNTAPEPWTIGGLAFGASALLYAVRRRKRQ